VAICFKCFISDTHINSHSLRSKGIRLEKANELTGPLLVSSSLEQAKLDFLTLKMGPIGCPETSVQDYHSKVRNIP
jgi:hypothetical protein